MRINQFVAAASGLSRRSADKAIADGRVSVNGAPAQLGQPVAENEQITLDGHILKLPSETITIILNKPVGYVCSRNGQGSQTIYDLLPPELQKLKPVGRLDKNSSGLLLLTNDGQLAQKLTHPKFVKEKVYEVELEQSLAPEDQRKIEQGVELEDGSSKLQLSGSNKNWTVKMHEGRNRQIRRTFAALDYNVSTLNRIQFGGYKIGELEPGRWIKA